MNINTNMIHNILNLIGLIVGALITFDWAQLGLDPAVAATIAGGVLLADKIIKLGMNITRDGLNGLFKPQPPVAK
jgi:hypothetical protein